MVILDAVKIAQKNLFSSKPSHKEVAPNQQETSSIFVRVLNRNSATFWKSYQITAEKLVDIDIHRMTRAAASPLPLPHHIHPGHLLYDLLLRDSDINERYCEKNYHYSTLLIM